MIFNAKIENPMLVGAIEIMKQDQGQDPKKRETVLEEILKASFLCPATVSVPPLQAGISPHTSAPSSGRLSARASTKASSAGRVIVPCIGIHHFSGGKLQKT